MKSDKGNIDKMPSSCAVATCQNNGRTSKERGIILHTFPKDIIRQRRWVHLCRREDKIVPKNSVVCSEHFNEDDYERDLKAELLKITPKRILKSTAEPHLKLPWSTENKCAVGRVDRLTRKHNKQLVDELLVIEGAIHETSQNILQQSYDQQNANLIADNILDGKQEEELETMSNFLKENQLLKLEVISLKSENSLLKQKLAALENKITQLEERSEKFETIFTTCQKQLLVTGKCIKWSPDDIAKAVTLRALSRKSYDYIKYNLRYPFPSECTIKRRLSEVKCSPGIIRLSLQIMKQQVIFLQEHEKDVILSFDEMKVQNSICYDTADDCFRGPHNYVQVFIARSLSGKWKQPVFYDFDCPVTKELLMKIITALEEIGFKVRGFVSDMGGSNRKLLTDLSIKPGKTFISNPYCPERKIWAFCDIPHALKLLRNHLIDSGIELANGTFVTKAAFEKLVEKNYNGLDLQYCHKLTNSHLILSGTERQNVRKAAQLLSETVSKAILYHFPEYEHVSEFVKTINDGFDVLNSRIGLDPANRMKSGYGLFFERQNEALVKLSDVCSSMRVIGKKNLLPFQDGFLISIESTQGLYKDVKDNNYTFLKPSKLNQDVLESYFSQLRGLGLFYDHPAPVAVTQRIKALLIGKNASNLFTTGNIQLPENEISEELSLSANLISAATQNEIGGDGGKIVNNTEDADIQECVDLFFKHLTESPEIDLTEKENISEINPQVNEDNGEENSVDTENTELVEYLAGYIAYRMKKKFPTDIEKFSKYGEYTNNAPQKSDWLSTLSKGKLVRPTRDWLIQVYKLESDFRQFHGINLSRSKNVLDSFSKFLIEKYPNFDEFALQCYSRTRSFFRMKALNKRNSARKRFSTTSKSRASSKKMKKVIS